MEGGWWVVLHVTAFHGGEAALVPRSLRDYPCRGVIIGYLLFLPPRDRLDTARKVDGPEGKREGLGRGAAVVVVKEK